MRNSNTDSRVDVVRVNIATSGCADLTQLDPK
jgi:hypothetical protein